MVKHGGHVGVLVLDGAADGSSLGNRGQASSSQFSRSVPLESSIFTSGLSSRAQFGISSARFGLAGLDRLDRLG